MFFYEDVISKYEACGEHARAAEMRRNLETIRRARAAEERREGMTLTFVRAPSRTGRCARQRAKMGD